VVIGIDCIGSCKSNYQTKNEYSTNKYEFIVVSVEAKNVIKC